MRATDLRHGAAAARAPPQPQRDAGRRADDRVQDRRRQRAAAARPQGPARDAAASSATTPREFKTKYGNVSPASIGAIQRGLLQLEQQGGRQVLRRADARHRRPACRPTRRPRRRQHPRRRQADAARRRLYATFLLWLLAELFERLPEVGDRDKPKLVFFFDEAHLLFTDAPTALLEKIEQVVRLIRSKGVGVFFVTQNPLDVPETVLGQLGNRVQHALRAFTPRDQKAVKAAAETMRAEPEARHRARDHRARRRRGAGLAARREGHARRSSSARGSCRRRRRIGPITPDERKAADRPTRVVAGTTTRPSIASRRTRSSKAARERAGSRAAPAGRRRRPAPAGGGVMGGLSATSCSASTGPRGGRREGMIEAWPRAPAAPMGIGDHARDRARRAGIAARRQATMNATLRFAFAAAAAVVVAGCGSPQRDPVPVTAPAVHVAKAPVARTPVAPSPAPLCDARHEPGPVESSTRRRFPRAPSMSARVEAPNDRKLIAIAFDEKVGKLCRTHPEMGPCQYERNICRGSGRTRLRAGRHRDHDGARSRVRQEGDAGSLQSELTRCAVSNEACRR